MYSGIQCYGKMKTENKIKFLCKIQTCTILGTVKSVCFASIIILIVSVWHIVHSFGNFKCFAPDK